MPRGRRGARRTRPPAARSRLTLAEVGGGWWRSGRMVEAAPKRLPPTFTNLHHPPPSSATSLRDPALQRIPRPLRPPISAFERGDVQRDRRQIVERDRPPRAAAPAAQLALALEPDVLDHHRPGPAERAVTLPPRAGLLARQATG